MRVTYYLPWIFAIEVQRSIKSENLLYMVAGCKLAVKAISMASVGKGAKLHILAELSFKMCSPR